MPISKWNQVPSGWFCHGVGTHTSDIVVLSGTVLLNIVPLNDSLQAEVYVTNHDAGFVKEDQTVKLKFMSYEFQKYGMPDAVVESVSSDSGSRRGTERGISETTGYRTLIKLDRQFLKRNGNSFLIKPGMKVMAGIKQGSCIVTNYIFSPIQGSLSEAAAER